jgi:uncharacterized repeat protein (TIGR01451 family)
MGPTVRSIVVTDTLPIGVQFDSASADSGFVCAQSNGLVTCSGGTLARDAVGTIKINVHAPNVGATITNTAMVDPYGAVAERSELNNSASVVTTVTPPPPPPVPADLTISSFSQAAPVQSVGQYQTYTINVSNIGQSAASGVKVTWTAWWDNGTPLDITGVKDVVADNGFWCAAPLSDYVGQKVVCGTTTPLNPNTTAHIQFSVLGSSTPTTATPIVTVDPDNTIPESNENNNQATLTTTFQ